MGNREQGTAKHPFSREELKKAIGAPEFGKKAKLVVEKGTQATIKIKIPMADGNLDSRVYAYNVVVMGDDAKARLFKNVFFSGVNCGIGLEPDKGVTTVEIPFSKLPGGKMLTIAVRPLSSLGTKGNAIGTTFRVLQLRASIG
ncbi:MAG: hypothetical protein K6G94_10950 [Kiritimatiellae bacterium]|nr:hypothetical protein [Kiritimatiellia bacterium]